MNIKIVKWALFLLVFSLTSCAGCSRSGIRSMQNKQSKNKLHTEIPTNNLFETDETSKDSETTDFTIGKVIAVLDGDTYDLLINGNQTIRIRMEGIDAPERGMPYYQVAKKKLSDLCFGKQIKLQITGKDDHGRILGFSYIDDIELSHEMIKSGLAWHYKKHNSDEDLANLELEARSDKRKIWSESNPIPPWEIRNLRRKGISTKSLFN